jgi:carbamoyl-phosphate synthase large subunit
MMMANQADGGWRRWTVAVTGLNARPDNPGPGLAVARCIRETLGFRGRIIGLSYEVLDPGLYHSGIFDATYLIPYPSTGSEAQLERLLDVHAHERFDALIPCLDAELANFAHNEPLLAEAGVKLLMPTREQLRARAKDCLSGLCRKLGLDAPETQTVADPAFFDRCADDGWQYPLVVKGIYYDAAIVYDAAEAKSAFQRIAHQWGYPVLVQKYVGGYEINLTALGDGLGGMVAPVMMRKRALTDKGKAWAGISIVDDDLENLAQTLIRELNWRGPLEVEALRGEDGRLYLIEVNPRFPAWVYLSHGVGRNLPAIQLQLMAGEKLADPPPARMGTMFIRYAEELIVSLDQFQALVVNGALPALTSPALNSDPCAA